MFPPKEIIQNLLMGIGPVRRWAQGRHVSTGLNRVPERVDDVYRFYRAYTEVSGKQVLEIGIGHTPDVLLKAIADGAKSAAAVDVNPYFTAQSDAERKIDYRMYDGRALPFGDGSFDVVWSSNVFQHLREPETTLREIARVLVPGGRLLVRADLRDHYYLQDETKWLDCLRYSDTLWRAMTSNRSAYVNRLRLSGWQGLLKDTGFQAVALEVKRHVALIDQKKTRPWLRGYPDEDISATGFDGVWRRP